MINNDIMSILLITSIFFMTLPYNWLLIRYIFNNDLMI